MEAVEAVQKVKDSQEFANWQKEHPNKILAHAFMMLDDANKDIWQIGYFTDDKMTTFVLEKTGIKVIENEEILTTEEPIKELLLNSIMVKWGEAVAIAEKFRQQNYSKEVPFKLFFILQQKEETLYNITFLTQSFSTLNVKVSAKNGKILEHTLQQLIQKQ